MIYKEFERDDAPTDHIAHGHLERMTLSGKDEHLETFVNSWDDLMLTFKTKPTESHLYSVLMSRLKKLPGLVTTVAHMDRQANRHPDCCFDFLMNAIEIKTRSSVVSSHLLLILESQTQVYVLAVEPGRRAAFKCDGLRVTRDKITF